MISETAAILSLYLATATWNVISLLALADSVLAYLEERRAFVLVKELGGRALLIAEGRLKIARAFVAGFACNEVVGSLAVVSLLVFPDPRPDTSLTSAILRLLLITAIAAFWRAKRVNRTMRRRADEMQERDSSAEEIDELARDTNVRVREMQERGQADQPLEQADRDEGRRHREELDRQRAVDEARRAEDEEKRRENEP